MANKRIRITQWGTFDLENYGDLLFPLVLRQQLGRRLGDLDVALASPFGGLFPFDGITAVARIRRYGEPEFYAQVAESNAVILGGGDLIRADDRSLAHIYGMSAEGARAARLFRVFVDDLGRLAQTHPVLWNAVGVAHEWLPSQGAGLRRALAPIRYLSVRDPHSQRRLRRAGVEGAIEVTPDTAFLVAELFRRPKLQQVVERLRHRGQFPHEGQVLTFQVSPMVPHIEGHVAEALDDLSRDFQNVRVVLLPICLCHDDLKILRRLRAAVGRRTLLVDCKTSPIEVAAVISHSDYFVGSSLHGNITAHAYGVDHLVLNLWGSAPTKLREYASLVQRDAFWLTDLRDLPASLRELVSGKYPVDPRIQESMVRQVHNHFDRLARELQGSGVEGRVSVVERIQHDYRTALSAGRLPPLYDDLEDSGESWARNRDLLERDLRQILPIPSTVILVDSGEIGDDIAVGHRVLPFVEREGEYWGPPADDPSCICEFERLHGAGAAFLVIAWPAFWWMTYYAGFHAYLRRRFRCICHNERAIVFDLHDVSSYHHLPSGGA